MRGRGRKGTQPTGRVIRGAGAVALVVLGGPDGNSQRIARSMAIATAPLSPMARGVGEGGGPMLFDGDRGFGVHRFAGKLARPVQTFTTPVRPIQRPSAIRVGMQAGPSSQPAFPSTGAGDFGSLALMSGGALQAVNGRAR